MKPILPKTVISGNGLSQVCSVLAAPGTTIILAPPIVRGGFGEHPQSIALPSSSIALQNLPQPTPVILPLATTKLTSCPTLVSKTICGAQQTLPSGKSDQARTSFLKERVKEGMGLKRSNVKNILPKGSQVDAQTLIIISPPAPTFLSSTPSPVISQSSSLIPKDALKTGSDKKCKIILQKNANYVVSGNNVQRKICEKKSINPKNGSDTSGIVTDVKRRKRKAPAKGDRKIRGKRDSSCYRIVDGTGTEDTSSSFHDICLDEKTGSFQSTQRPSKGIVLQPNELYPSEQDIPHHPPPPYPSLLSEHSSAPSEVKVKQTDEEKVCFINKLSSESSPSLKTQQTVKERDPSTPPQFTNFFEPDNYQTCNPPVPSKSYTGSTKLECSVYTSNSVSNHSSTLSQSYTIENGSHSPTDSSKCCSYVKTSECSLSPFKPASVSSSFSRSVTPTLDPPSYSSPHSVKYQTPLSSAHLPSSYSGNYCTSSVYSQSLASTHSQNIQPHSSVTGFTTSTNTHVQLSSPSPHSEMQNAVRKLSTSGEDMGPPLLSSVPLMSDSSTSQSCSQSIQECSHTYVTKSTSYPVSPSATPLSYSSQGSYHVASQQASPYSSSLTPVAPFSQSPQMNSYSNIHSPQPSSYTAPSHSSLYDVSPQASIYTQSPQQNFYSPPQPSSSYSHSHQPIYPSPQAVTPSVSTPHSGVSLQNPQSLRHHFPNPQGYSDSPHQPGYCQSPNSTPVISRQAGSDYEKDCQSPLLPPYSFPHMSSSSQYASTNANMYADSSDHHSSTESQHVVVGKSLTPEQHPCDGDKFSSVDLSAERSLSPPSYEAHFQNALSFSAASHSSSSSHNHLHSQQPSTPEDYSLYHHTSRYDGQNLPNILVDHKSNMGAPPAYPTSTSSTLPLPPLRYVSDTQTTPGTHHLNYSFTPDICNDSQDYSPLEHTGSFFPNTPPMLPLPAAPPPMENQFNLPSASTSQGHSNTQSASYSTSFASATYYKEQESHGNRPYKTTDQQDLPEHHTFGLDSNIDSWKGGNGENSKVHDLIEKAEKLWFIPHQEQNKVYMKRKELAKDILNHSVSKSSRDTLLKEKFWIEEDEPISEEITNSSHSNYFTEEHHLTDKVLSQFETPNTQVPEGDISSCSGKPKLKKNMDMLCQICGKMLKGRNSLKSHLKSHHNIQPHACPYCSKSFSSRSILVQHLWIHTGEKPYVCAVCDRPFRTRAGLTRHKSMHSDARPFECSMCTKAFKTKIVLQQHLKLHLTGLFTCPVCNKTFERHKSYVIHKASHHHNTKRYHCTHCLKGYRFLSLLNHHMQIHVNVRKHVCSICSKGFVWRSGLAAHMKTHSASRPKCDICGARFLSEKRLETHYRRHSNKKPHCCDECGHSFAHAYRLAAHKVVHQRNKELPCSKCSLVFSSMKKLKKHLATHKKDGVIVNQPDPVTS
ncbi:mucin-3B-like [Macrobrachium nipponense]|uniref:mucin-3B-like n=1 Tax=Macrobrachium nipponense TaxID=159736 RepID=UPI0030C840EB